jgi:hypothetical protein
MFLSKLGYSELVQRLFEKMAFFLVDPLPWVHSTCVHTKGTVFRQKKNGIRVLVEYPNIRVRTTAIKR